MEDWFLFCAMTVSLMWGIFIGITSDSGWWNLLIHPIYFAIGFLIMKILTTQITKEGQRK